MRFSSYLCVLSLSCSLVPAKNGDVRTVIAQCRAMCVNVYFSPPIVSDRTCRRVPDCFMCWETCEMLHSNFTIWGPMCSVTEICFDGCQRTCDFYYTGQENDEIQNELESVWTLSFVSDSVRFVTSPEGRVLLEWSRPTTRDPDVLRDSDEELEGLVYVISVMTDKGIWREIKQTSEDRYVFSSTDLESSSKVRLVAVSEETGQVAQSILIPPTAGIEPQMQGDEETISSTPGGRIRNHGRHSWKPHLVTFEHQNQATVIAKVLWPSLDPTCKYEVVWRVQDSALEATGRLYTEKNNANITLWPGYSYAIKVKCFGEKGAILKSSSRELEINTRELEVNSSNTEPCTDHTMWPVAVISLSLVAVLLLIVAVSSLRSLCAKKNHSAQEQPKKNSSDDVFI